MNFAVTTSSNGLETDDHPAVSRLNQRMKNTRDLDVKIAEVVFGHSVSGEGKTLIETTAKGERPLRKYTTDLSEAWAVAERFQISLIPIENGQWFAFAGPAEIKGWRSPRILFDFLNAGEFTDCGASLQPNPAHAICEAALIVAEKRRTAAAEEARSVLHLVEDEPALH